MDYHNDNDNMNFAFAATNDYDGFPNGYKLDSFPHPASCDNTATTTAAGTTDNSKANLATDEAVMQDTASVTIQMMTVANDELEHELSVTKTTVKRILTELVALQSVTDDVYAQWTPMQVAEHKEAHRLNELQTDVHGSVGMALPLRS